MTLTFRANPGRIQLLFAAAGVDVAPVLAIPTTHYDNTTPRDL
jgi:hypothetical protein